MPEVFNHNGEVLVRLDLVESVIVKSKRYDANPYSSYADPQVTANARNYGLTLHLAAQFDRTRRNENRVVHLNVLDVAAETQLVSDFMAAWEAAVADNVDNT